MKKFGKIMTCMVLALAITGCKNKTTPSNGNDSVVSLTKDNFQVTVDDLYQTLKEKYATNYIIQEIDNYILDKEYKTDEEANDYLENQLKIYQMMYGNDEQQLLTALQNSGYRDLDEFKNTIITNYKRTAASKDYVKKNISEEDINKYYENNIYGEITVSHILVKLDSTETMTDDEKKEAEKKATDKIKEIYEKLDSGTAFADVAKEYSEDTATKDDGGKIGTFTKGQMTTKFNKEFEDAAMNLEVGKYTKKTITSSYGYHIIYKDEQKEKPKLDEVKDTILDALADEALESDTKTEYKAMIKLREDYGLTFNDDTLKQQYDNAVNNWLYSKDE